VTSTGKHPVWLGSLIWPALRGSRRMSRGQAFTRLVFVLMGLGIAAGIYFGSAWFLGLCYQVEAIGPLLCRRLLDLMLMALLGVLLLSNIITSLSSFFLAQDLELMMAAPVPARSLFGARFVGQTVTSSWMVLSFGLPTLLAFASVAGSPMTYLAIGAVLLPLLVFPAAAGTAFTLLLVRFMPAARVRDLVVGLMFVGFLVLYLLVRLAQPERFMNPEGFSSLVYLLTSLSSPSGSLLPSNWGTAVIASTFREAPPTSGRGLALAALWTGAGASYVVASALFRRFHRAAFSRSQEGRKVARLSRLWARLKGQAPPAEGPMGSPGRRAPAADWMRLLGRLMPRGAPREFVIKDTKLLLRDASQWSQLVLLLALVFVYLYNFRHFRQISEAGLVGPLALYVIGMGLCAFVTTAVSVRFAFPLISLEGRMLWLIRSAPLRPGQVIRAKLISTLPPLLLMSEAMSVISSLILGVGTELLLLGALVAGINAVAIAALATGLGAVLPDYRADSAARVAASFGGLICMSTALVVSLVLVGLAFYPALVLHRGFPPNVPLLVACAGGALLLTAASVALPLTLGARALAGFEP
jgi:ABC-2 type transport system permease protein